MQSEKERRDNVQTVLALRLDTVLGDTKEVDQLMTSFPDIPLSGACLEIIRKVRRELDFLEHRNMKRAA